MGEDSVTPASVEHNVRLTGVSGGVKYLALSQR